MHTTWMHVDLIEQDNEFVWSDDEAELLLNVADEHKVCNAAESIHFHHGFPNPHLVFL